MSQYWSPVLHRLKPYTPGEQPALSNLVKLNTNENPYPPSPRVLEAIHFALGENGAKLARYPDPNGEALKKAVAHCYRHCGIDPSQVFVGNSSDEVLAHIFQAFFKQDAPLLMPDITYSFYTAYCRLYEIEFEEIPLDEAFTLRTQNYLRKNGGIIFPNPNAPTGIFLPLSDIESLLAKNPQSVVVIDEAYVDFGGETAIPLISRYPNLLVAQTFSKSRALAGLRVGFAVGHPDLIEGLERVKNSFNSYLLDRLALAGAVAALEDEAWFLENRKAVIKNREKLKEELLGLGFEVLPSLANFLFVRHPRHEATVLAQKLRERSIIVRHFNAPRIDQYLRITVGTPKECALLADALTNILT